MFFDNALMFVPSNRNSSWTEGLVAAGIQFPTVIDAQGVSPTGEYVLMMVEERPWDGSTRRLVEIQERVNVYLEYVLSGTLKSFSKDANNRHIQFWLYSAVQPDSSVLELM